MTEYKKREIAKALPAGTNKIGNVNEARGRLILYDFASAQNAVETVKTVSSGKTYYLLFAGLSYSAATSGLPATLFIDSTSSILLLQIAHITPTYQEKDSNTAVAAFPHPIPISEDSLIEVQSTDNDLIAKGWIIGWEE